MGYNNFDEDDIHNPTYSWLHPEVEADHPSCFFTIISIILMFAIGVLVATAFILTNFKL